MTRRNVVAKTRGKRGERFRSGGDGGSFAIGTRPGRADRRRRRGNARRRSRRASRAARRSKASHAQSAQPAPHLHRRRARRTGRLDPRARHHPADRGARSRGEPGQFEIIAGERRWRAAQRAGLHEVPIAMVEATDAQSLEFAIIENVQRADLNPIEEAAGYRRADGGVQPHARTRWRRSSARAGRMSPTRCGC